MGTLWIIWKKIFQFFVRLFIYSYKNNIKMFWYHSLNILIRLLRSKKDRRNICYFGSQLVENDQVYSNTWVSTHVNTSQHDFDTSQNKSTRVQHESTQINTTPTQANTNQHESARVQYQSTRINASPTKVNTNQQESKTS